MQIEGKSQTEMIRDAITIVYKYAKDEQNNLDPELSIALGIVCGAASIQIVKLGNGDKP